MNLDTTFIQESEYTKTTAEKWADDSIMITETNKIDNSYKQIALRKEEFEKLILKALEWKVI
jgi:hypothetical protein